MSVYATYFKHIQFVTHTVKWPSPPVIIFFSISGQQKYEIVASAYLSLLVYCARVSYKRRRITPSQKHHEGPGSFFLPGLWSFFPPLNLFKYSKVVYMSASFWLLAVGSPDLSQEMLTKLSKFAKWQLISLKIRTVLSEHTFIISFSAWDKSCDPSDNSQMLEYMWSTQAKL